MWVATTDLPRSAGKRDFAGWRGPEALYLEDDGPEARRARLAALAEKRDRFVRICVSSTASCQSRHQGCSMNLRADKDVADHRRSTSDCSPAGANVLTNAPLAPGARHREAARTQGADLAQSWQATPIEPTRAEDHTARAWRGSFRGARESRRCSRGRPIE